MRIPENCENCQELVRSRRQIVYGYGKNNSKIMFVGICPGNHMLRGGADMTGIPFCGDASGNVFDKMLQEIGLTRNDVYTTNLVKCRPACNDIMYNRLPTNKEIFNCLPFLKEEIIIVKPKLVICLGKIVFNILEEGTAKTYIKVYNWHPAFISRSPELFNVWCNKIKENIDKYTKKWFMQHYLEEYE